MLTVKQIEEAKNVGNYSQWLVDTFKHLEANNTNLLKYIQSRKDNIKGPEKVNPELIIRTVGPEPEMLNHESVVKFQDTTDKIIIEEFMAEQIVLLCEKFESNYYLLDGNHTFEALKKFKPPFINIIYTEDRVIYDLLHR